jgi:hypothetical protein
LKKEKEANVQNKNNILLELRELLKNHGVIAMIE